MVPDSIGSTRAFFLRADADGIVAKFMNEVGAVVMVEFWVEDQDVKTAAGSEVRERGQLWFCSLDI
jgi:hypothetical protein